MPQKFVNLENLTSFWGNAKEYIGNERKEIEDQLYNWQKTEKAPLVQCEPVPNSELHPTVEFMFKETLPEGEKGPNNPSVINGVNSIEYSYGGKNLLYYPTDSLTKTLNGVTFTYNNGSFSLNGTSTAGPVMYRLASANNNEAVYNYLPAGTYTLSGCPKGSNWNTYALSLIDSKTNVILVNNKGGGVLSYGDPITFTIDEPANVFCMMRIGYPANTVISNITYSPQLEIGSVATSLEPANRTKININLNNTYYGGSINLATGLMTVTWAGHVFDGTENFGVQTYTNIRRFQTTSPVFPSNYVLTGNIDYEQKSTHFVASGSNSENSSPHFYIATSTGNVVIFSTETTNDGLKAWLASQYNLGTPLIMLAKYVVPPTVQLTPQQIKSLSSLEGTSKRINTIYTDVDSVQVEYQKYVGIDSTLNSDSVNAIQNKVVNSALNTKVSLSGDEIINGTKTFSNAINGSITGDAGTVAGHIVSKDVPINAAFTDTTYDPATQSAAGLMSASDKVKLDAVGSVFTFKGSVIDDTYLPASDNVNGDAYLAEDTGHVHVYNGTSFVDIGIWAGIPSATDAQIDALFED